MQKIKKFVKDKELIILLILALIMRISISSFTFHVDVLSIAGWGRWIFQNGPMGFYEANVWFYSWPTQPPLVNFLYGFGNFVYEGLVWFFTQLAFVIAIYHLAPTYFLWWFDFVKWFADNTFSTTDYKTGFLISLKFAAIIADLIIATLIYFLAKKIAPKRAFLFSLLYLASPFSWYISSLWGQYDQISYLFLLLAMFSLNSRYAVLSATLLVISIGLKPTSLIFIPLYSWILFRSRLSFLIILLGIILGLLCLFLTLVPFSDKNLFIFLKEDLFPKIFLKSEFRLSTNSFNFWHILVGNRALTQDAQFFYIPGKIWGYLIFGLLNILAFKFCRVINTKNMAVALFIVGMGGFLFLANMLERYAFAGVVSGLILTIFYPRILRFWLILSMIFWINLYNGWWYPNVFNPIKELLMWQDGFLTRILSLLNVLIFLLILKDLRIFQTVFKKFKIRLLR